MRARAGRRARTARRGKKKEDKGGQTKGGTEEKKAKPVTIDFEGLGGRVARVPVDADNIEGLAATKGYLLYVTSGAPFYGRDSYEKTSLKSSR